MLQFDDSLGGILTIIEENYRFILIASEIHDADLEMVSDSINREVSSITITPNDFLEEFTILNQTNRALRVLDSPCCETVVVTKDPASIPIANEYHLGTILFQDEPPTGIEHSSAVQNGPDYIIEDVDDFELLLSGRLIGYLGEALAMPQDLPFVRKDDGSFYYLYYPYCYDDEYPEAIVTGRYFKKSDPRFNKHALSAILVNSKSWPERHIELLGNICIAAVRLLDKPFDYITRIPPRPSAEFDRLGRYLESGARGDQEIESKINLNLLRCIRDFEPQKMVGKFENRARNVEGVFEARVEASNRSVVLVDDILTSGETVKSAIRSLRAVGCNEIYPVIIAIHPSTNPSDEPQNPYCTKCGGKMVHRFNKQNGEIFWGCENYYEEVGCNNTLRFIEGLQMLNVQYADLIAKKEMDEDIPF